MHTLMRKRVDGKIVEVKTGDILLTTRGKTFYVTGWNEFNQTLDGITTCEQKLFVSAPVSTFNCYFIKE